MALTYQERAAQVMEHLVGHDGDTPGHGYSQYSRLGDGGIETITLSDGSRVTIATGDRDCSSAVIDACEAALPGSTGGATFTGNMRECFLSTGLWEWHPMGDGYIARRGDVYLNEYAHTAMCKSASPDMLMQFSISENGTIDGREGDQTGWESNTRVYYSYPWDGKLVYVGPQPGEEGEPDVPGDTICGVDSATYARWIRELQGVLDAELRGRGLAGVSVDGAAGPETQRGVVRLLQDVHNGTWGAGLDVDGIIGPAALASMAAHPVGLGCEEGGDDVWCVKMGLVIQGWDVELLSREWGGAEDAAMKGHQQWHGLATDGVCGADTLPTLLPLACA